MTRLNRLNRALIAGFALGVLCAVQNAVSAAVPAKSAADVEVDRVELSGSTIFGRGDIESSLELTAGDRLDRQKVVRTAENLQTLYRSRGYEMMQVKTVLEQQRNEDGVVENVLRFKISEGAPTRVASVGLVPEGHSVDSDPDPVFTEYWQRRSSTLIRRIGIEQGDILNQDKIAAARRVLQEELVSEEFVGARVEDVRISVFDKSLPTPALSRGSVARWVNLEFRLNMGDRVAFGFRGNTVFTRPQLLALVEEQRVIGLGNDYVGAIRSRIADEYRSIGYIWVKVSALTFEKPKRRERHVTFVIDEGPRVRIESVNFDGNYVFENNQLRREFFVRSSELVQKFFFVEKDVEKAAALVIEWMKSEGYLSAKLITINRTFSENGNAVRLLVYLYEGEQTIIKNVHYSGLHVFQPEKASSILGIKEGAPLNLFALNEGLESIKAAYRAKGHLEARVTNEGSDSLVRYSRENRYADISVEITEGYQYRISRIEIEGVTGTREDIVRRELTFHEGDVLEERLIGDSEARLRRLGIYAGVSVRGRDDPERPGFRIVRVAVQEGTPGVVGGGVGYRNDLGLRVFGQVAYTDVWSRNHTLSLNAAVNKRINESFCSDRTKRAIEQDLAAGRPVNPANYPPEQADCFTEYQVQLGYTWPWFALGETTFRPTLTVEQTQYNLFDANSVALAATWERRLMTFPTSLGHGGNLVGTFTYSLENTRQFNAASIVDNQTLRVGALIPSLRLDLRDNSVAPTSGFFASSSYELASPSLGSRTDPYPIGYTRFQIRADSYVPLFPDVVWFFGFRTGIERNTQVAPAGLPADIQQQYQIPIYKQFALGGAGSLRGFSEQELNVQTTAIQGTCSYVNYRTQIDLPFAGPLRFGPFLDAGNLLVDRYSLGMLRYGTGIGFHYLSPVGAVNFDWGFKVNPRPGEDPFRFYLSIGTF